MDEISLVDAVCLIQINVERIVRNLYYYQPVSFDLTTESQYLLQNCISDHPKKPPFFYSFSLQNYTGFAVFFEACKVTFSLVIISQYLFPSLFFEYLHEALKFVLESNDSIEKSVDYFWEQLSQWTISHREKTPLPFPYDIRTKKLNDNSCAFEMYDPWTVFPNHMKFQNIWRALIICASVKVIGEDEEMLTKAVFSILSLIKPYKYEGKALIILNSHDQRLSEASKFPVFGVLKRLTQSAIGDFTCIITQSSVIEGDYEHLRRDQYERMERLQIVHLYLMDRVLIKNPYNDLLELPYIFDSLEEELRPKDNPGFLTAKELKLFEKTETAKWFRQRNILRDEFRNSLLSVSANEFLPLQSPEQLEKIKFLIKKLRVIYQKDAHMMSVLKTHMKLVKKQIDNHENKIE